MKPREINQKARDYIMGGYLRSAMEKNCRDREVIQKVIDWAATAGRC